LPKHFAARPPLDTDEERQVRKLAQSRHASADWIAHAKMAARSWDGLHARQIAEELRATHKPCGNGSTPSTTAGSMVLG
jgi:hypothetical protein